MSIMEMPAEVTIRRRVLIRLKSVNDSMKKSSVRCRITMKTVNRMNGPGAVYTPGTNASYSSFSKKRFMTGFLIAAMMVIAAAFMPGVFRKISISKPIRKAEISTKKRFLPMGSFNRK
jgi:hypothetical protein